MEVGNLFVCIMGMSVTFIGLTCLILLTVVMGKIVRNFGGAETPVKAASGGRGDPKPSGADRRYFRGSGGGNGHGCDRHTDSVHEKGFIKKNALEKRFAAGPGRFVVRL